jgi:hypothetical protein
VRVAGSMIVVSTRGTSQARPKIARCPPGDEWRSWMTVRALGVLKANGRLA